MRTSVVLVPNTTAACCAQGRFVLRLGHMSTHRQGWPGALNLGGTHVLYTSWQVRTSVMLGGRGRD